MYRCSKCGQPWDDARAEDNEFTCYRRCGGGLVAIEPLALPDLEGCDLARLPYPVALTAHRLAEALRASGDVLKTLFLLKDCFEATVKYLGAVLLAEYRRSPACTPGHNESLLERLVRPSLGDWVSGVADPLSRWLVGSADPGGAAAAAFARPPKGKGGKPGATPLLERCQRFVTYRNDALGHGARRADHVYEADVRDWLPLVRELIDAVAGLAPWRLSLVTDRDRCQVWTGPSPTTATEPGVFPREWIGRFILRGPGGECRDLDPFLCYLPDRERERRLHYYDSLHAYRATRREVNALEYDLGFKQVSPEPVAGLEEAFTAEVLARAFGRHRGRMEVIEGRVANFGALIEAHAAIVGRRFVIDHVRRVLAEHDRGLLVIEGQPGKGKTALLAHLIEEVFGRYAPPPVHFFYRRTAGITDPDVCLRSLYHALLDAHAITEAEESKQKNSPDEVFIKMTNLLSREIAPRLLPGRPQLIFIDALDEAAGNAFRRIPEDLPAGVYVIATTRPVSDHTALARRHNLFWYDLDAPDLVQENLRDGSEYVHRELVGSELSNEALDEVARVGGGNFLVLKLLCQHLRTALPPDQVAAFLRRLATDGGKDQLGFIYGEFWQRLTERCSREDMNLLFGVAGVLVTAHAPLTADMVCGVLALRPGDWDFALRHLAEYLTVVEDEEDRGRVAFYRLYHESFADFLRAKVATDRRRLHGLLTAYCLDWPRHAEDYTRRYVARFGLRHCHESGRPEDAPVLALRVVGDGRWEHLAELIGAMHQVRPAAPDLAEKVLDALRGQISHRARLVLLVYNVWRMPTAVAAGAGSAPELDQAFALLWWIVDLVNSAIKFTGILAAADYLRQDESAVQPLREAFRRLERPTLGQWAAFQRDYSRRCAEQGTRPAFAILEKLSGRAAKDLDELQAELVAFRNRLAHRATPGPEQAEQDLDWLMKAVERYFQVIAMLAEGQLLVLREHLAGGRGRFQVFAGPNPQASSTVDLPCSPGNHPGEVFFSLGESGPVSLYPFVLTEAEVASPVPLLLYERTGSGRAWRYSLVGGNQQTEVDLGVGPVRDVESVCRAAQAEWQRSGRPLATAALGDLPPAAAREEHSASSRPKAPATPERPFLLVPLAARWKSVSAAGQGTESFFVARDCVRAYLWYRLATLLGIYVAGPHRSAALERDIVRALQVPTPGQIVSAARTLTRHLEADLGWRSRLSPPVAPERRWEDTLNEWVSVLNELLHTPRRPETDHAAAVKLMQGLAAVTRSDPCLLVPRVLQTVSREEVIDLTDPERPRSGQLPSWEGWRGGQLVQVWPDGACTALFPLIWGAVCPQCAQQHFFFWDRLRSYSPPRKLAAVDDPVTGHALEGPEPLQVLESWLGEEGLRQAFQSG